MVNSTHNSHERNPHPTRLVRRGSLSPRGMGGRGPPADPERPLVHTPARQPGARGDREAPPPGGPPFLPDQAPGADRQTFVRPENPGGGGSPREGKCHPAQCRDGGGRAVCEGDRPLLQRIRLLPDRVLAGKKDRGDSLPGAGWLHGRSRACRGRPQIQRGLRDEPPEQHGLHPRGLPGGDPHGVKLRRGGMGADLASTDAHSVPGGLLHTAKLREPSVSTRSGAIRRDGDRGRGRAGDLSGRRPFPGRGASAPETRPARLYDPLLSSRRSQRYRLHPGRNQLRPDVRGPQPADLAGQRSPPKNPSVRDRDHPEIFPEQPVPHASRPMVPVRLRLRQLRHSDFHEGVLPQTRGGLPGSGEGRTVPSGRSPGRGTHDVRGEGDPGAAGIPRGDRVPETPGGRIERTRPESRGPPAARRAVVSGRPYLHSPQGRRLRRQRRFANAYPSAHREGRGRSLHRQPRKHSPLAILRQLHPPPVRHPVLLPPALIPRLVAYRIIPFPLTPSVTVSPSPSSLRERPISRAFSAHSRASWSLPSKRKTLALFVHASVHSGYTPIALSQTAFASSYRLAPARTPASRP